MPSSTITRPSVVLGVKIPSLRARREPFRFPKSAGVPTFPPGVPLCRPTLIGVDLHADDRGSVRFFCSFESFTEFSRIGYGFGNCALRPARGIQNPQQRGSAIVGQSAIRLLKLSFAGIVLQFVDYSKPAIVQHQDDQLFLTENRRIDVRIEHHVRASSPINTIVS